MDCSFTYVHTIAPTRKTSFLSPKPPTTSDICAIYTSGDIPLFGKNDWYTSHWFIDAYPSRVVPGPVKDIGRSPCFQHVGISPRESGISCGFRPPVMSYHNTLVAMYSCLLSPLFFIQSMIRRADWSHFIPSSDVCIGGHTSFRRDLLYCEMW